MPNSENEEEASTPPQDVEEGGMKAPLKKKKKKKKKVDQQQTEEDQEQQQQETGIGNGTGNGDEEVSVPKPKSLNKKKKKKKVVASDEGESSTQGGGNTAASVQEKEEQSIPKTKKNLKKKKAPVGIEKEEAALEKGDMNRKKKSNIEGGDDDEWSREHEEELPGRDDSAHEFYKEVHTYEEEDVVDEADRRNRSLRRRSWCCCLLCLCLFLALIIFLIIYLLLKEDPAPPTAPPTPAPTFSPFVDTADDDYFYDNEIVIAPGVVTSEMSRYDYDCDFTNARGKGVFPHVFDQCDCDGEISNIPQDVINMRQQLVDKMLPVIYENSTLNFYNSSSVSSCDPINMALVWLASGDKRDAGEIRQRFILAMTFFALNGTIWDYNDEWLGDLNECLWLGVQCNNRDVVNSLALDTNNIFGLVRISASSAEEKRCERLCATKKEEVFITKAIAVVACCCCGDQFGISGYCLFLWPIIVSFLFSFWMI